MTTSTRNLNKIINVNYQRLEKTKRNTRMTAYDHYRRVELIDLCEKINTVINKNQLSIPEIVLYSKDNKTYMVNEIYRTLDKINELNVQKIDGKLVIEHILTNFPQSLDDLEGYISFYEDTDMPMIVSEDNPTTRKTQIFRFFCFCITKYRLYIGKYIEMKYKFQKIDGLLDMHSFDKFNRLIENYYILMKKIKNIIYNTDFDDSPENTEEEYIGILFEKIQSNVKHTFFQVLNNSDIPLTDL